MTYFIESDKHWRISKSGYSIKVGFMDATRIVCTYPFARTSGPFDGEKFSLWMEDAEHICELHNASVETESIVSELRARIAALEAEKAEREDAERINRLEAFTSDDITICPPGKHGRGDGWLIAFPTGSDSYGLIFDEYHGATLREAIDAARGVRRGSRRIVCDSD